MEIARKIGYENFDPSRQQYVIQLEQAKQMEEAGEVTWDILKGVGIGAYDIVKDTVVGAKGLASWYLGIFTAF
ncbi:Ribonuclease YobL [Bacillus velezensis]|nr:Ribonuclease YobL [Bacillus velezensis]